MAEVLTYTGVTTLDCPAERILDLAAKADLDAAVVVGWTKDGEFYFASSVADGPEVLWLIEIAKKKLLTIGES